MIRAIAAAVAVPLLVGPVVLAPRADASTAMAPSGQVGLLLAQDSGDGVAPFPIAPQPGGGSSGESSAAEPRGEIEGVSPFPIAPRAGGEAPEDSSVARPRGETEGVSPFPLPPATQGSGDHSAESSAEQRWVEPSHPPEVAVDGEVTPGGRSEQEVGVPAFPYDPEARADSRRACVRACADHRDVCARADQPVERCEGDFVLCFRDCATGSGPDAVRPPGN